jgi:hypothetical protein
MKKERCTEAKMWKLWTAALMDRQTERALLRNAAAFLSEIAFLTCDILSGMIKG